jgi:hypothetical protein
MQALPTAVEDGSEDMGDVLRRPRDALVDAIYAEFVR